MEAAKCSGRTNNKRSEFLLEMTDATSAHKFLLITKTDNDTHWCEMDDVAAQDYLAAQGVTNRVTETPVAAAPVGLFTAPAAIYKTLDVGLFTAPAAIHKTLDVSNWVCHGCGHQKHH